MPGKFQDAGKIPGKKYQENSRTGIFLAFIYIILN